MDEALERKDKTICYMQGEICIFFNHPKDVNISGEMTFCSIVVKDHFKITFNIKKMYIDIDGNVIFYILNTSH